MSRKGAKNAKKQIELKLQAKDKFIDCSVLLFAFLILDLAFLGALCAFA
jgi:hypothetical protein